MEEEVLKTLENIGLTEGESKAYLALISLGTSTVGPIIEKSGVSASKVYVILDRLIAKGLATIMVKDGKKLFSPTPPEQLLTNVEEEQKKLEQNKESVQEIIPILKSKCESVSKYPIAEYTEGRKGSESLHAQLLQGAKPDQNYLVLIERDTSFKLQQYWSKYSSQLAKKKINQFNIYDYECWHKKDPQIHRRKERKLYYPRVLDKKFKNLPSITVLGNNTIITGMEEGKIFTLMIRNKKLTNAFTKLLLIIRETTTVPKGFKDKELVF